MSREILGIDIRQHCIAAALVKGSLRENHIAAHAVVPVVPSDEGENSLAIALEQLTAQMDIGACDCVISIPADQFSFRNLQVPFGNPNKIRMVVPYELEPTLPFSVQDLAFDFQILNTVADGEHTNILVAAIERSRLTPYLDVLARHKIDPEIVTINGLPTALCLADQVGPDADHLFVEIDAQNCTLIAIASGQIQLIRSFPLSATDSSRLKMLGFQIRRTLAAFEEMHPNVFQPLDMFVSGSGLKTSAVAENLSANLSIPVKAARLADHSNVFADSDVEDSWNHALMDNALALAIMEIEDFPCLNFHKGQFAVQKFIAKNKKQVVKTAILAAAAMVLIVVNFGVETYTVQRRIRLLDHQITAIYKSTFPEAKKIQDPYMEMQAHLKAAKKKSALYSDTGSHVRSIDILDQISQRIPKETAVDLTRLVISPENVIISGNTDTFNSVDDIKGRLEKIEFFKKVNISSADVDRSGKEVRFMIKAEL